MVIRAESRPLTSVRADTQKIRHGFILCDDSGLTLKLSSVVEVHRRAADNALRVLKSSVARRYNVKMKNVPSKEITALFLHYPSSLLGSDPVLGFKCIRVPLKCYIK